MRPGATPRLSIGARAERAAPVIPTLPAQLRRERLEAAIAHLRALGIIVSVSDRDAAVRKYRVTGKAESKLADDVIAIAVEHGMAVPA